MKTPVPALFAALLALAAAPYAMAAANPIARPDAGPGKSMRDANVADTQPGSGSAAAAADTRTGSRDEAMAADAPRFVSEPIASASSSQGPDGQLATSIAQALNAEPALKESKIAVVGENGKVTLSGATMTREQQEAAVKIAQSQAGEGNVIDALQSSDIGGPMQKE